MVRLSPETIERIMSEVDREIREVDRNMTQEESFRCYGLNFAASRIVERYLQVVKEVEPNKVPPVREIMEIVVAYSKFREKIIQKGE